VELNDLVFEGAYF